MQMIDVDAARAMAAAAVVRPQTTSDDACGVDDPRSGNVRTAALIAVEPAAVTSTEYGVLALRWRAWAQGPGKKDQFEGVDAREAAEACARAQGDGEYECELWCAEIERPKGQPARWPLRVAGGVVR